MSVTSATRMDGSPKTREELLHRLEEAEETIRAIRQGEVDALVVQGAAADQVFTLHGGDYSYRAFMETMGHGAAALNAAGEVLYANTALTSLLGKPLAQLQGSKFVEHFAALASTKIGMLLEAATRSGDGAGSCELDLWHSGESRHFLAAAEPLEVGLINGWALTFTDLTDKVRAEKSLAAERAVRAIIASANEAMLVCDLEGRISYANAAVSAIAAGTLVGELFSDAIPLHFHETVGVLAPDDIIRIVACGDSVQGIEAHAPEAPRAKDLLISAAPISPADGVIHGCVITLVDLSLRKAAEERQNLLMAELDHRVKNTLTSVLAILHMTSDSSIAKFKETFSGRVHALSATHHLLSACSWSNLSLEEVFSVELEPFLNGCPDRAEFEGPRLLLKPQAAIAIGLVFHELATNAVKYGALSTRAGRISLTVSEDVESLTIEWLESGGPPVVESERKGFGRTLIASSLRYLPGGGADIEFRSSGLRCLLRVPPSDICRVPQ